MKKIFTLISILFLSIGSLYSQAIPEILYYKFDGTGTSVPNLASAPPVGTTTATLMGAMTQGSSGQCHGALVGTGTSSSTDYLNTGWAPNIGTGSWTLSFWTGNITPSSSLWYILGDVNTNSLRCFTNGVAGPNNWILRGGGLTDVLVTGGATVAPHVTTFVYDNVSNNVYGYLDGVLVTTVAQGVGAVNITGTGPFKVGAYSSNSNLNGNMDEFRMYDRALSATEVAMLVNPPNTYSSFNATSCANYTSPSGNYTYTASGTYNDTIPAIGGCADSVMTINVTINPLPTVAANATSNSVCAGSVVTLTGSGAINYTWDNSVTDGVSFVPTATTTYMVTGTDGNGCSNTDMITVNVNQLPAVAANTTSNSVCDGSAVTLTGSGALNYTWDNSVTDGVSFVPSSTLTYMVTGTDGNGCTNTDMITVNVNQLPTIAANATSNSVCAGSVVTLTGSGAVNYTWDNSVTDGVSFMPSSTLTYMVTGTDANGCVNTATTTVTVNALPTVALGADVVQCGGTAILDAQNAGATYLWSDASTSQMNTISSSGTYYVDVTDANGCSGSDTILVTINTPPTVTGTATSTSVCLNDAAVTLNGSPANGTWSGPGVTGTTFDPTAAGTGSQTVVYTYTDANSCTNTASFVITVNACVGVAEASLQNGISVYPNPNNGVFILSVSEDIQDLQIVISDLQGRIVYSSNENNIEAGYAQQINLQNESAGMYLMQINGNGEHLIVKISVQK